MSALKNTPVALAGLTLFGVHLQDWVLVLSAIWLSLQISGWIYDRVQRWKGLR